MDDIDEQILTLLEHNSRLSNKELGELVHLTGQAVGARILKLQEKGIIRRFTIERQRQQTQFIRIFMDNNRFTSFERTVNRFPEVSSLFKVSGQACYMIIAHFPETQLPVFIEEVSKWARYSVEVVVADKTELP